MPKSSFSTYAERPRPQPSLGDVLVPPAAAEAPGFPDAAPSSPEHEESLQLARAVEYIERNLTSRTLTPASVAEAIHVSRSTLYRMFAASGGVNRYIVRARLDRAWNALAGPGPGRRVSEVAFGLGFQSDAHFCRAFRRAFGVTPGHINGAAPRSGFRNGPDVSSGA